MVYDGGKKIAEPPNYNLGLLYERGLGVPANKELALKYFSIAANAGFEDARKKLLVNSTITGGQILHIMLKGDSGRSNAQQMNESQKAYEEYQRQQEAYEQQARATRND